MAALSTDLFDYVLPEHLIAQTPAAQRDGSRLLVVHRATRTLEHLHFTDLPRFLGAGDCLFRNNAAVLPARLLAQRPTGGHVECLLLRPESSSEHDWWCLLRPGKKLPAGAAFARAGEFTAHVQEWRSDGTARVTFTCMRPETVTDLAQRIGEVPLPPYIHRDHTAAERAHDLQRYQTVYADPTRRVAAAAPTAGLHFTSEILEQLSRQGVDMAEVTLHVGLGTFKPIATSTIDAHEIHRELYEIPAATQRAVFQPRTGRRVAVGTTAVRTLEDFALRHRAPVEPPATVTAEAAIYLYPPRHFNVVDALITNFHQPRSTLLCLVSAFLTPGSTDGIKWLLAIYREAIAREYRFFSYGDAMLIL